MSACIECDHHSIMTSYTITISSAELHNTLHRHSNNNNNNTLNTRAGEKDAHNKELLSLKAKRLTLFNTLNTRTGERVHAQQRFID